MTTHPIPDVFTLGAPEQPATMAGLMFWLAAALEILPQPISVQVCDHTTHHQVHAGVDGFEAWRQWLGAPEAEPGEWEPYETSYMRPMRTRHWTTAAEWRGHTVTLVRVEMVPAEKVPA